MEFSAIIWTAKGYFFTCCWIWCLILSCRSSTH